MSRIVSGVRPFVGQRELPPSFFPRLLDAETVILRGKRRPGRASSVSAAVICEKSSVATPEAEKTVVSTLSADHQRKPLVQHAPAVALAQIVRDGHNAFPARSEPLFRQGDVEIRFAVAVHDRRATTVATKHYSTRWTRSSPFPSAHSRDSPDCDEKHQLSAAQTGYISLNDCGRGVTSPAMVSVCRTFPPPL